MGFNSGFKGLNNLYHLIQTGRHYSMTASRLLFVLTIRLVRLGIVVKEFQISRYSLAARHPEHTTNGYGKETHTATHRKLVQPSVTTVITWWSGMSRNILLTEVEQYVGSFKQCRVLIQGARYDNYKSLIEMTNKMQLSRTIYYSIVPWPLNMFRAILSLIIRSF